MIYQDVGLTLATGKYTEEEEEEVARRDSDMSIDDSDFL